MGSWLVRYFSSKGDHVTTYDVNKGLAKLIAKDTNSKFCGTLGDSIRHAETVFVAVPMEYTTRVVSQVASISQGEIVVAEIASLKEKIVPTMRRLPSLKIFPLSLHPLFGPGLVEISRGKIAVVRVCDKSAEEVKAKEFFPKARLFTVNPTEHDRMMAYSLTLPYIINFAFGSTISKVDTNLLRLFAGTTLSIQMDQIESILQGGLKLATDVVTNNPYSKELIDSFKTSLEKLVSHLEKEDSNALTRYLKAIDQTLSRDPKYKSAYARINLAVSFNQHKG